MAKTAMDLVAEAKQRIREIDQSAALEVLGGCPIVDVREPEEYAAGSLPGAVNIPRGVLEFRIDAHPACAGHKEHKIIVYCQTGGRSALAAEALQKIGYLNPVSLAGGFKAWSEAGLPTQKP